jgi:hypothetical protein
MGMMNVPEMRRLARVQRFDFMIALLAVVATLLAGVLAGVVIGIALSLLWLIAVTTRPNLPLLGRQPGTQTYRDLAAHPDDEQLPEVAVLRVDGGLFFATSDAVEDRVRDLIHRRPGWSPHSPRQGRGCELPARPSEVGGADRLGARRRLGQPRAGPDSCRSAGSHRRRRSGSVDSTVIAASSDTLADDHPSERVVRPG